MIKQNSLDLAEGSSSARFLLDGTFFLSDNKLNDPYEREGVVIMYQIGVDIGGTNIKFGLVDQELNIVQRSSIPFPHVDGEATAMQIAAECRRLLSLQEITEQDLASVGVIVPGSISPDGEMVLHAYNLDFHFVPLRDLLQKQFEHIPVFLANDADGACLAELGRGAFVGAKTAVLFTLGTGVGGGLILGGKMFSGGKKNGVELGHMPLVYGGESCSCGNSGCIEAYCSASALGRQGAKAMQDHPESLLAAKSGGDETQIDAKFVVDCAKEGDETALQVFHTYVDYLGTACIAMIHLFDPEVIAFGGGLSHAGDFLFEPLRENVAKKCFYDTSAKIAPAVMGNDAGIIGAAMLGSN